jgi:glycosyltransferase involved in cell wall biosynthesis
VHIGFLSPSWPANESTNGIVTYTHYVRQELIRQGHQVTVFTPMIGRTNQDSGIHLVKSTMRSRVRAKIDARLRGSSHAYAYGAAIGAAVRDASLENPIDVLEMEESFGWCAEVRKMNPLPVVVKLHGPAFLDAVGLTGRQLDLKIEAEGESLRQIDAIISPSQDTLDRTIARYRLTPAIARTIPNPIALESDFKPWDLESCERKTLLFVGRFDRRKGGDMVLQVFRKLLDTDKDLKLIFVGPDIGLSMPDGSRVNFASYCDSLFSAEQRDRIAYLGRLPRLEIGTLRTKGMATLVFSQWDNQPNTALEAMIQGCPIVGSDTGGMGEVIEHGVTGLLARAGDVDDHCRQILGLLSDPRNAAELGRQAAVAIAKRHSAAALATQALEVYRQAIEAAGGRR